MIRETAVEINKKMLPLKDDGFYQAYKEKLTPTTHRLQINRKGILLNPFYIASIPEILNIHVS